MRRLSSEAGNRAACRRSETWMGWRLCEYPENPLRRCLPVQVDARSLCLQGSEDFEMNVMSRQAPVQPGERAPDFNLAAVFQDGELALADYRGRPLFLAIFLGLWCPFCRRNI